MPTSYLNNSFAIYVNQDGSFDLHFGEFHHTLDLFFIYRMEDMFDNISAEEVGQLMGGN